jgi:hypothetical protein
LPKKTPVDCKIIIASASIARAEFPRANGIVALSGFSSALVTTKISLSDMEELLGKRLKRIVFLAYHKYP